MALIYSDLSGIMIPIHSPIYVPPAVLFLNVME